MRRLLIERYRGKTVSTSEIVNDFLKLYPDTKKNTLIWYINELIKDGDVVRLGRGKYHFSGKMLREFKTSISKDVQQAIDVISKEFKYVKTVLIDSEWLSDYLVQQPFATIVKIEVNEPAVDAVSRALRRAGISAFSSDDISVVDKYFDESRIFAVDKIRFHNPTCKLTTNLSIARLEKIMVDIVCDYDIFKQYQGWELENIYRNITEACAVNFSTVTKYAASRGRKSEVLALLADNPEYQLFLRGSKDD